MFVNRFIHFFFNPRSPPFLPQVTASLAVAERLAIRTRTGAERGRPPPGRLQAVAPVWGEGQGYGIGRRRCRRLRMSRQAGRAGRTREQSGHSEGHSFVHQPPPPPGKLTSAKLANTNGEPKAGLAITSPRANFTRICFWGGGCPPHNPKWRPPSSPLFRKVGGRGGPKRTNFGCLTSRLSDLIFTPK